MENNKDLQRLLTDLGGIPGMIYQYRLNPDGSHKFLYVSAGAAALYEQSPEAIMEDAANLFNLTHPDDVAHYNQTLVHSVTTLQPWFIEARIIVPSGKIKWLQEDSIPHKQPDGSIIWNGILTDITDRKNMECKIRLSEELLKETGRLAKVGGWELDIQTMELTWSEELYRIHELNESVKPDIKTALYYYAPEARAIIKEACERCAIEGVPYDLEVPFITAKGKNIWVRSIGQAHSVEGKIVRVHGIVQDITERKQAEERLNVVFEFSTDAHFLYDDSGIIDCNAATVKMLGYQDKASVIGRQPSSFSPEYQPDGRRSDSVSKEIDEAAHTKGVHQFEWVHQRPNGEQFTAEVTINPVLINNKPTILTVLHDLTKHKNAESQIKLSEARLMETQELTHTGSWEKDIHTGQNYWSAETFRIFGLEPAGACPSNEEIELFIHPDDRWLNEESNNQALYQKQPASRILRILPVNQDQKYVQVITKPFCNEKGEVIRLYGSILDITEQKNTERTLLLKQNQLKRFIEFSPVAIAMFDKNMRYIAVSRVWLEVNNQLDQQIIGRSHYEINPHIPNKWKESHQRGLAGEVLKNDGDMFVRNDGQIEWVRWEVYPWFEKENEIGGIIMFTEVVTEQRKAKQELIEAKEQAEQGAIAKSQFLSTMSHEIRTPMNAVIGITHLLLQNDPRPDQLENLKTLRFSAENLLVLINDILDFNKIEAGKIDFEEVDFSIEDLVRNVRHALLPKAEEKGVSLKLMLDDELPEVVVGDPVRLGQVLNNLISNAVKFTPQGKIVIDLNVEHQDAHTSSINFSVTDTGIGISEENQKNIFESFTQATADITRKFGGTGLGLAITKRLLELQGSQIQVKSTPGKGSTFFFTLSFKNSTRVIKKQFPTHFDNNQLLTPSLKGIKILMAEDYAINVMVAKQFLLKWDIELDIAENGLIALEMAQQKDYDLVLMDLQMPEMDGYKATAEIRKLNDEKYRKVPIIALTASAMLDIKDKAFEVGMSDYISKPFNPNELYKKITKHITSYRANSVLVN